LNEKLDAIAKKRQVAYQYYLLQETADAQCDEKICQALGKACKTVIGSAPEMLSGAGHDAMKVSHVCPMGMLAVRSRDGLSHHPDEYSSQKDIEVALKCLVLAIIHLDENL
jgi:allantoate deiminase